MSKQAWDDVQQRAFRLVLACGVKQDGEDDLRQTRLVARALRIGIDSEVIERMLRAGCEKQLADHVRLKVH